MPVDGIAQPETVAVDQGLRRFAPPFDVALVWYLDPEIVYLVDGRLEPYDMEQLTRMYRYLDGAGELYWIEARQGEGWRPIGDVTLCREDMPIVIGDPAFRGKGVGKKVIAALITRGKRLGFTHLAVSEIYDWNTASRRCFEAMGFRACEKTEKGARYRLDF